MRLELTKIFVSWLIRFIVPELPIGGSPVEMKYALLNYGIPAQSLPFDDSGRLVDDDFKVQVAKRRKWEEQVRSQHASSDFIEYPTRFDVLLGRGRPYQDFPGNVRLNQIVELRYAAYEESTLSEKTEIVVEIVHAIKGMGGRFLTRAAANETDGKPSGKTDTGDKHDKSSNNMGNDTAVDDNIQYPSTYWVEVDFKTAHRKVSVAFQTRKRRKS